ncbi:hypothetical protein NDU88_006437 [Pleurodeles waltl]|uniref:Uncharacterized protein n=1 Tax=Pleurodeles waltl TaxID=8319 RepID=A0AAV7X3R2_PLEWA|nr:hypothetical protein NDU88_006437 [Pleurodeles waltl]
MQAARWGHTVLNQCRRQPTQCRSLMLLRTGCLGAVAGEGADIVHAIEIEHGRNESDDAVKFRNNKVRD